MGSKLYGFDLFDVLVKADERRGCVNVRLGCVILLMEN